MKLSIGSSQLLIFIASSITNSIVPGIQAAAAGHDHFLTPHAMPPNPEPYQVTYPDGGKSPLIHIRTEGSLVSPSHQIYEETLDGFLVKPATHGDKYVYLDVNLQTGDLFETDLIAGENDPYASNVSKDAAKISQAIILSNDQAARKLRGTKNEDNNHVHEHDDNQEYHNPHRRAVITTGTLNNLVVPFKFSDHGQRSLPSQQELDTFMNSVEPDDNLCPTGSVRDVYLKNSFNNLQLESTVHEWVTLDTLYTEAYCSNGQSGLISRIHECLTNALDKVVAAGQIDFSTFDRDNDNFIDGMTFFHSGYAAEWGGIDAYGTASSNRIWSHKWSIWSTSWTNAGVRVYDYHINPALWSTRNSDIGRIGVVAHETGHFLGLPDLYDYGSGSGIGSYGLMANSWGFDFSQYYPPHMSAWAKETLGWVTPTTVSTSGSYSLERACANGDMIKIDAGYPAGEYLLIENRQKCNYDSKIPQGGLVIFHIDNSANNNRGYPSQTGWPTNGNHYKVAVLQADGNYNMELGNNRGDGSDVFHGSGVSSIGPNGISTGRPYPNTKSYQSGNIIDTEVTISNISDAGGNTMTFDITIGGDPTQPPVTAPPTQQPVTPTRPPVTPTQPPVAAPPTQQPVTPTQPPVTPTRPPVAAPPTQQPVTPTRPPVTPTRPPVTSPPTQQPVASPTATCKDKPGRFNYRNRKYTCQHKNIKALCHQHNRFRNRCPFTCGRCNGSQCTNKFGRFRIDGKQKIWCLWAERGNSKARCGRYQGKVFENCPGACDPSCSV